MEARKRRLYQYDQLNRITESQAYDNQGGQLTAKEDYRTSYSYDANGNLLSLHRNATSAEGRQLMMDELTYVYETKANGYKRNTNKLRQVKDAISASNYSDDIDSQQRDNYAYDEIGNLTKDQQEGITKTDWTVYGKMAKVSKADGSFTEFRYDAAGNRIAKRFKNQAEDRTTHYVRDASGNIMAIYEQTGSSFKLIEQPIYGSDMVGQRTLAIEMTDGLEDNAKISYHSVGVKAYYLKNHLSNNLVSVSDRKDALGNAVVLSATDYYAFGKGQPGRSYLGNGNIKIGFNGKRRDDEGEFGLTAYDYGFRIYNPDIGKFLSVDPLTSDYSWYTPYQFAGNKPISAIDLDGLEEYSFHYKLNDNNGKPEFRKFTAKHVDKDNNKLPLSYRYTLNRKNTSLNTIEQLQGKREVNSLMQAGLEKIRTDNQKYGNQFPEEYYQEFGKFMFETSIEINDGNIDAAATEVWNALNNETWTYGSSVFHLYENFARQNDNTGHDKLLHFTASAYYQYNYGAVYTNSVQFGKEFFKDEVPSWFGDDKGWDPKDVEANEAGQKFGKELQKKGEKKSDNEKNEKE